MQHNNHFFVYNFLCVRCAYANESTKFHINMNLSFSLAVSRIMCLLVAVHNRRNTLVHTAEAYFWYGKKYFRRFCTVLNVKRTHKHPYPKVNKSFWKNIPALIYLLLLKRHQKNEHVLRSTIFINIATPCYRGTLFIHIFWIETSHFIISSWFVTFHRISHDFVWIY